MWKPLAKPLDQAAETLVARTRIYDAVRDVRAGAKVHADAMDRIAKSVELLAVGVLLYLVWKMWPDD